MCKKIKFYEQLIKYTTSTKFKKQQGNIESYLKFK